MEPQPQFGLLSHISSLRLSSGHSGLVHHSLMALKARFLFLILGYLTQAELFVRQRERPGLRSPAVAWPPSLSAGRRVLMQLFLHPGTLATELWSG